ncbi:ribosomal protein S18-alanine N-acetyltransferase [Mesobacillus foraminis]|jgi:ribosomal-protein-alanine N-acetyltransferase|uniref:[Ribosomal protein bS18]-alanine N-acetyltransferase n=1 Tax=Mesobacillus foraminis TaxID=279826 RepID=A0A4R2AWJ0_9BACI|nr:ribosomal protein S18-alanine N-acetyltransferase [Mesobacillus foraminis]MBT2758080.1 ribosomal protein S18-alanine N-acetyltransferase [Mesobacillus foraminis]TCN18103.1 ribosomal-protein-alanine N-acetyltransferase [Mesobacillus foraminis]
MNNTIAFRAMELKDIDRIHEIETKSFATPWSKEAFHNELTMNKFALYTVIEVGNEVAGYCGAWVVIDEVHITNIALLPEYRGMKLGEALLRKVMDLVKELGAKTMTLEVRVSNLVAQSLYRKLGFQEGAIRKQYYTDNLEDALVMWVNL